MRANAAISEPRPRAAAWLLSGLLLLLWATIIPAVTAQEREPAKFVVAQLHPAASDENPGTPDQPWKTISHAAGIVQPGDTVTIMDGVYRELVKIETSGTAENPIVFEAAPMANVVVTGAQQITDWQREEGDLNIYSTQWPYEYTGWSKRRTQPDDDYHIMIGRAEQIHVDNYPLLQVLSKEHLARGTFFADLKNQRLYIHDRTGIDIIKQRSVVEASVRQMVWDVRASHIHTRGIRFRYACNTAQMGAVTIVGDHCILEDCILERMNASGAALVGTGITVRRCTFRENGWSAFDVGLGHDFLMTECLAENNHTKNWNRGWGAVNKLVLCRNAVIEKSIFRGNRGNGVWFDIGNENCVVRNCLIQDNEDAGIFYEISYGLHAHDNVIIGNGLAPRFGAWGANGGIAISSSPDCVVERNLLIANKEGFQFREQGRTTNTIGDEKNTQYAVWNHDNTIRNNVIAYNRDAQVAGWIATGDGRLWPRRMIQEVTGKAPVQYEAPAEGTDLNRLEKAPAGMALEELRLTLDGNLYAVRPGQHVYQWGCLWDPFRHYDDLAQVSQELGFEGGSKIAGIEFADWTTLDLRVPADSPILQMGCYPQGEVPGVRLGIIE